MSADQIYNILWYAVQGLIYTVGVFATIAQVMPSPKNQKGFMSTKVYHILYRIVNIIGANNLWAKNFNDPKQKLIWQTVLHGVSTAIVAVVAAKEASSVVGSSDSESPKDVQTPNLTGFKMNGQPVISSDTPVTK